ncbi:MAG TPA: hypothetical protein VK907_09375, partial [Phnomibacter sp.]|nr:hypothetical protein [Phnomibacter sp.]
MYAQNLKDRSCLVLCIGNASRGDDAIGWLIGDWLRSQDLHDLTVEYRYQLQVEDAALVQQFSRVLFVDAINEGLENGFELSPCLPAAHYFFSSHRQSPETILYLSERL